MDPLSLTVGIITILGAGGTLAKGLGKIRALKHAPGILLALNNEVADIEILVREIDEVIRQHQEFDQRPINASICRALGNTRKTLLVVEKLIAYELTVINSVNGEVKLDRKSWLRSENRIRQLQEQMRNNKVDLSTALLGYSSYVSAGLPLSLFSISSNNNRLLLSSYFLFFSSIDQTREKAT